MQTCSTRATFSALQCCRTSTMETRSSSRSCSTVPRSSRRQMQSRVLLTRDDCVDTVCIWMNLTKTRCIFDLNKLCRGSANYLTLFVFEPMNAHVYRCSIRSDGWCWSIRHTSDSHCRKRAENVLSSCASTQCNTSLLPIGSNSDK